MDEAQIAARVAQNIPQDEPEAPLAPTPPQEPGESAFKSHIDITNPDTGLRLADFMGVGRTALYSEETQRDMKDLYHWASEYAKTNDIGEVLDVIAGLEAELGVSWEKGRLQKLAHWVRLHNQAESLRKQMDYLRHASA